MRKKNALDPLFSRTLQGLLAATCLDASRSWYLSDLAKHLGRTPSSLQRPLARLVAAGLLKCWKDGNRVYYQADSECPFLPELRGVLVKTIGLSDALSRVLSGFRSRIQVAFVYGSIARGEERSTSDVDLLIIGDATMRDLSPALEQAETELGRPVNATVCSAAELARRLKERNHFLRTVLGRPKLFVVGTQHELEEVAGRGARRRPSDEQG